jgi:hypothetical protein
MNIPVALYQGRRALVIHEQAGRILLRFSDASLQWVLRGAPDLEESKIEAAALVGCRASWIGKPGVITAVKGTYRLTLRMDQPCEHDFVHLTIDHPQFAIELPDWTRPAARRGRPREFGSNAEKQRAYRERQKALRNSAEAR